MVACSLLASCATSPSDVRVSRSVEHTGTTEAPSSTEPPTPTPTPTASPASDPTNPDSSDSGGASGARGVGDVLFPDLGNPGIDVTHYEVDLSYAPGPHTVQATETMTIVATADLADFSLDAVGPVIASVSVDGVSAGFVADNPELVITPPTRISRGNSFTTTIVYSVTPAANGSQVGVENGWFPTSGGSYVMNEPDGARTWLPSNDHPSDKASFRFTLHVPAGLTGVANGRLESHTSDTAGETWIWNETDPMATYLIQVLTGSYTVIDDTGPHGLPLSSVILTTDRSTMQPFVDAIPSEIDFFEQYFGRFPLQSYGVAITDSSSGLAMEEQGRSLFSRDDFVSGRLGSTEQLLLSHELAHQWFGDAVSPARWQDIWLNESFATYGEWMWLDHVGVRTLAAAVAESLQRRRSASGSTAKPSVEKLFDFEVYEGGAVVLQALRLTIGDDAFFSLLKSWVRDNIGTSRTTGDFVALAEKVAGKDLTTFFNNWLYATRLPDSLPAPFS